MLVHYFEGAEHKDETNIEYLINILDLIINQRMELTQENYKLILEEILITSTENKNSEYFRIITKYTQIGKELACV